MHTETGGPITRADMCDEKRAFFHPIRNRRRYDERAKGDPVKFDEQIQRVLIHGAIDICNRRKWRLHAVGTEAGHAHYLISWRGYVAWNDVMQKLKNLLSFFLGKEFGRAENGGL